MLQFQPFLSKIMKKILFWVYVSLLSTFVACDDDLKYEDKEFDALTNFNFLWKEIDEKYCFFDYKKDSIKDWNEIHNEYELKIYYDCNNIYDYFDVLGGMLAELKDGHVNLYSSFDISRYDIGGDGPVDYDYNLISYTDRYLGDSTRSIGGFRYKTLRNGRVGYIRYADFSSTFSHGYVNNVLTYFEKTDGLIIDVRNNGGGYIDNVNKLVAHFIDETTIIGYRASKTGKGHSDFSEPVAEKVSPVSDGVVYKKPVYILTNSRCYSATNEFVYAMKGLPRIKIIGAKTGGGCGMPITSELPCGWKVRFSANPCYDRNMKLTEFGVEPDIELHLDEEMAYFKKLDNIIETACDYIVKSNEKTNDRRPK